jgi:hypothetical protein
MLHAERSTLVVRAERGSQTVVLRMESDRRRGTNGIRRRPGKVRELKTVIARLCVLKGATWLGTSRAKLYQRLKDWRNKERG